MRNEMIRAEIRGKVKDEEQRDLLLFYNATELAGDYNLEPQITLAYLAVLAGKNPVCWARVYFLSTEYFIKIGELDQAQETLKFGKMEMNKIVTVNPDFLDCRLWNQLEQESENLELQISELLYGNDE